MKTWLADQESNQVIIETNSDSITKKDFYREILRRKNFFLNKEAKKISLNAEPTVDFILNLFAIIIAQKSAKISEKSVSESVVFAEHLKNESINLCLQQPWVSILTSGSTGTKKEVILSGENFYAQATAHQIIHNQNESDSWICCLPLSHIGGLVMVFRAFFLNQKIKLMKFQIDDVLQAVNSKEYSSISLVPTMLSFLLKEESFENSFKFMKNILVGGAKLSQELKNKLSALSVKEVYGSTETCSQIICEGAPLAGVEYQLGANNILRLKSKQIAVSELDSDGWWTSNDLATVLNNNILITGRADEIVITGGKNIHPSEVEKVLESHFPDLQLKIIGLPDKHWGQKLALIVDKNFPLKSINDVCELIVNELARWKLPKELIEVSEFPLLTSGKINFKKLKLLALEKLNELP